ncbi:N-acetylmuramoyl-L-alanine amidase [uncultured Faecalibaculum sp.]|uniref:N-acetylmuramoyl-L-alanine amidase family protein n=1 Tax=uncultured Faecalibaculum sp. TaxID=1729681 RepID=UPI0025EC6AC6|nr:N-acetylmuramoyl-L-alanine amidase [uncultured Faecalibaculum sp.]
MKKAAIYLLLGLFALLVLHPGLDSSFSRPDVRVPAVSENGSTTNEDATLTTSQSHAVIAIDAGHGGTDYGYASDTTIPEKDINLDLAQAVGRKLAAAGYQVIYTRESDDVPDFDTEAAASQDRISRMKQQGAQYLVSVQLSSSPDPLDRGFAVFTQPSDQLEALGKAAGQAVSSINLSSFEGVDSDHYSNFPILMDRELPSILLELGYITNPDDYAKLTDTSYQDRIGEAVAEAFLKVVN